MTPKKKPGGVLKAVYFLSNMEARDSLSLLDTWDLVVLRDAFSAGATPKDVYEGLKESKGKCAMRMLGIADMRKLQVGNMRVLQLPSYVKSQQLRTAYPVSDGDFEKVRSLYNESRFAEAVMILQKAINRRLEDDGKKRKVRVELGAVKEQDEDFQWLKSCTAELPAAYRGLYFSASEQDDTFTCQVAGYSVTSEWKSTACDVARILSHRIMTGQDWSDLEEFPDADIEKL